jgi:hypothetical protein
METESTTPPEKTCMAWANRRERDISLRIRYSVREEDGCKIYSLNAVQELE